MATPFQCGNCLNWYTPVQVPDGQSCWLCDTGGHAPHQKTGAIDCHFGQKSSTTSEVILAQIVAKFETAKRLAEDGPLERAEAAYGAAKADLPKVADAMSWAGVFEMPGRKGDAFSARYRSFDQMGELIQTNRRPPEDLEDLRRSLRNCEEMKKRIDALNQEALEAIVTLRMAAKAAPDSLETREMVGGGKK